MTKMTIYTRIGSEQMPWTSYGEDDDDEYNNYDDDDDDDENNNNDDDYNYDGQDDAC